MFYTTLNRIRACSPHTDCWQQLLQHLGKTQPDDEPLSLCTLLDIFGLHDAIAVLVSVEGVYELARLFAVRCIRQHIQPLLSDPRSFAALDVAERFAVGEATEEELSAAWSAAWDVSTTWEAKVETAQEAEQALLWDAIWAAGAAASVVEPKVFVTTWSAVIEAEQTDESATGIMEADFRAIFCEPDAVPAADPRGAGGA